MDLFLGLIEKDVKTIVLRDSGFYEFVFFNNWKTL